jgi:hypothetical protein
MLNKPSLQKKKRQNVDTALCDRFYSIYIMSGLKTSEFSDAIGVASFSYVNEIKNYILEPSKNMIVKTCDTFNLSADWLLFGIGDRFRVPNKTTPINAMIQDLQQVITFLEQSKKK